MTIRITDHWQREKLCLAIMTLHGLADYYGALDMLCELVGWGVLGMNSIHRRRWTHGLRSICLSLLLLASLNANGADLVWNASVVDEQHAAPTGYRIHRGPAPGAYDWQIDAGNVLQWPIPDDLYGSYYWAASAYNDNGSSGYSNEIFWQRSPPEPPQYVGAVNLRASRLQIGSIPIMAWSHVNTVLGSASGVTTVDTPDQSVTAGNTLIVAVGNWKSGTPQRTVSGISDTAGNTYTKCGDGIGSTSGGQSYLEIWKADNVTGHATNVITATLTGSSEDLRIAVIQLSGMATSAHDTEYNPAGNTDNTSPHSTTAANTAEDAEVIIGAFYDIGGTVTAYSSSSPSVLRGSVGSDFAVATNDATTQGPWGADVAATNTEIHLCLAKAFKSAAAGGASAVKGGRGNLGIMRGMSRLMWLENDFLKPTGGN